LYELLKLGNSTQLFLKDSNYLGSAAEHKGIIFAPL
jgi:hypothetical protein